MTNSNNPEIEPLTRTQILVIMGVTAVVLLLVAKGIQWFANVPILPIKPTLEGFGLALGLASVITLGSSILYRLWPAYSRSADFYLELILKPLVWPDLIWLGLLPGLSEELLFRGVMLPALGFNITAVIVSSILFGVLHLSGAQQWPYVVWATVVGLMFGFTALYTGNLLIPIVAHTLTNLVSSCLWKWKNS
ncbi:MAG: CPBP family intramembrane glutamic endopeptidase [Halothece sp.]